MIENCIYGVDIQPIALQIAKLRCFISLVVEQKVDIIFAKRGFQIDRCPAIRKHLEGYRTELSARATIHTHPWYELQQPQEGIYREFEKTKIIIPTIVQNAEYAPDYLGHFSNDKTSICVPKMTRITTIDNLLI